MATRVQIAKPDILAVFNEHPRAVLRRREIERILAAHRTDWRLAQSMRTSDFIEYLVTRSQLRHLGFAFPHRQEVRYTWGDVPLEEVLLTLKPDCHFSHYTAMQMHELTEQDSKTVYLNHEQPPKPPSVQGLAQERIDAAFARKPRVTNNVARFRDLRICMLNGKHTGYAGVETREIETGEGGSRLPVRVTDIERTLIDIAVRPFYAGGVAEVLKAYERAGSRASANRLAALLRQLGHVYPYHQAVGFYMERSGSFRPAAIDLFRGKFEFAFDFYLTYQMTATRYDKRWRIHVPEGL